MCVQESLIIQNSYNTNLMIQIFSCVPALRLVEKHPGYPQELMLWTDTQQDWYWYAGSKDSLDTIHPV